jgi:acyl transferase domain-containing protein
LDRRLPAPNARWECSLDKRQLQYLEDHRIGNDRMFPGAGYVEAGLALYRLRCGPGKALIEDLRFHETLRLGAGRRPLLVLEYQESARRYSVHSGRRTSTGVGVLHASGRFGDPPGSKPSPLNLEAIRRRCPEAVKSTDFYSQLRARGLNYGPRFQGVREVSRGAAEVLGQIHVPAERHHHLHPAVLDAALQSLLATRVLAANNAELYLPVRIQRLQFHGSPGSELWSYGRVQGCRRGLVQAELTLCDASGQVLVEVQGLRCLRLNLEQAAAI